MAIPFVLMGFAFLVMAVVFSLQWYYAEKRIAALIAARFDLSQADGQVSKPGLRLRFDWSSMGHARVLHIEYEADLPAGAKDLSLSREGWESGLTAMGGTKEQTTGDVDFDDYFWIASKDIDYLNPARRSLLLSSFERLSGDASIGRGKLRGRIMCEQSPGGVATVTRVLQQAEILQSELDNPDNSRATRPPRRPGWVAGKQCRTAASYCWLAAAPVLAISNAIATSLPPLEHGYDYWVNRALSLTSLLLLSTGAALFAGSRVALPLARTAQVVGCLTIPSSAPYWLRAATPTGTLMCPFLALALIYGSHLAYATLSRVRLV